MIKRRKGKKQEMRKGKWSMGENRSPNKMRRTVTPGEKKKMKGENSHKRQDHKSSLKHIMCKRGRMAIQSVFILTKGVKYENPPPHRSVTRDEIEVERPRPREERSISNKC